MGVWCLFMSFVIMMYISDFRTNLSLLNYEPQNWGTDTYIYGGYTEYMIDSVREIFPGLKVISQHYGYTEYMIQDIHSRFPGLKVSIGPLSLHLH